MRKVLIVISLLVIIFLSTSFIILRLSANGSEDNLFNREYRAKFAAHPFLRQVLALHFDGDAKEDYLGSRYKTILVEVDEMEGLNISHTAMDLLKEKIQSVTGKEVQIIQSDTIPYQESVTDKDIAELVARYRNINFMPDAAKLYLLYLSKYNDELDHLGSTYQEYGLLLYDKALRNFSYKNSETLDNYVESTALHEFGHQAGLGHNEQPGCLMNTHVEQSQYAYEDPKDVVVDFCDYEKRLLKQ